MSRFNATTQGVGKTTTHEGAESYVTSPRETLYTTVVSTFLSDKFYESGDATVVRIRELLPKVAPEFAWRLAIYAREEMNLRSVPIVLAAELIKSTPSGAPRAKYVRRALARIIQRPDEITEFIAYWQAINGGSKASKLPHVVRKALGDAFNRFDAYKLAKYRAEKKVVSLVDALRMVHPTPKDEAQSALFGQLRRGEVATPYTWETRLSEAGQKGEDKRLVWEELLDSGQVGYMALLRNLRNLVEADVSTAHIERVCARLADPKEVEKSKQLPFRFYSAYREIATTGSVHARALMLALENAATHSVRNMEGFDASQRVAIVFDVSGSMQHPLSAKSSLQLIEVGQLLAGLAATVAPSSVSLAFATKAGIVTPPTNVLGWVASSNWQSFGGGTNGHIPFQWMLQEKKVFDRVLLFSDKQMWQSIASYWREYRKNVSPGARLYSFDLAGYGRGAPVDVHSNENAYLLAGWSDSIFRVLRAYEDGSSAMAKIESVQL